MHFDHLDMSKQFSALYLYLEYHRFLCRVVGCMITELHYNEEHYNVAELQIFFKYLTLCVSELVNFCELV